MITMNGAVISDSFSLVAVMTSFSSAFFVWLIFHWALARQKTVSWQWISVVLGMVLFGWFFAVVGLSRSGFFLQDPLFVPNIAIGFLVLFEVLRRLFSVMVKKIAASIPMMAWLTAIQTYRILGVSFLTLHAQGLLPATFAFPAGYGDILVGATAPLVAIWYYRQWPYARPIAVVWNVVGIIDLIVAIGTGWLSFPLPVQILPTVVSTEVLALFPMAIVPLFAVPVSLVLHFFCLKALKVARNNF